MTQVSLPPLGRDGDELLAEMKALRDRDADWYGGKVWSLVYHPGDELAAFIKEAHGLFFSHNGLNPTTFPSLRRFETEVVGMVSEMLRGDEDTAGTMTSGGTESILLAVKASKFYMQAQRPDITQPEVVSPISAHPALDKACHYLGLKLIHTPVREDYRADLDAMREAIGPNTVLVTASAPSYPHGVIDPIEAIGALAQEKGLCFHVDTCIGGFMLPFLRELGHDIPPFGLEVPGVTSISCDAHKYGYAAKGASTVLYRNRELRRHQFFVYTEWTGGIYASPSLAGTRPGGSIAAAWAMLNRMGWEGYKDFARRCLATTHQLIAGIEAIDGLFIIGQPDMTIFAFGSDRDDIFGIGDELSQRGWALDRQQTPPSLHLTVMVHHEQVAGQFLEDLRWAVNQTRRVSPGNLGRKLGVSFTKSLMRNLPDPWVKRLTGLAKKMGGDDVMPKRQAAMYGMMGELPDRGDLHEMVLDMMDRLQEPVDAQPANGGASASTGPPADELPNDVSPASGA